MINTDWLKAAKLDSFDDIKVDYHYEPFNLHALYDDENYLSLNIPYLASKDTFAVGENLSDYNPKEIQSSLDIGTTCLFFKNPEWSLKALDFIDFSLIRSFFTRESFNEKVLEKVKSDDILFYLPFESGLKGKNISQGFSAEKEIIKGANKTLELSTVLRTFYQAMKDNKIEDLSRIHFHFFNDSDFILDTAKIRAFRFLYYQILKEFDCNIIAPYIHIEFHPRHYLINEEETNIMRQTNSLLSGMLSNAQSYSAYPYTSRQSDSKDSKRLIKTMQWLLKEEAYLLDVYDPLKGSYLIETATYKMAESAWEHINKEPSDIEKEIAKVEEKRKEDIKEAKLSLLGANHLAPKEPKPSKPPFLDFEVGQ